MADETKTQIPKPTRQRGPMGRMGGMRRGEKAKDFKGTMRQLLGYIGQHKIAVFAAVAFAVCSVIFNIVGPKVLGQVTTKLFEGLVAKVNGTGDVDFDWIAKTLGFLLCLYLASSVCSLVQGWLMTGVTQKICYRMRKEIAAKIAVVPMSYFNGHSKGDVLSRITNDVDTLGQSLNQSVTQLITSVTQIIGVLVMMLSISLPLTGVTVLTLPAAAIILTVMIHFSQPYFREQQQVLGAVNGIIEEDFAGQNVIQVFDRAEASIEEFDRQNDRLFISGWRSQFLSGLMMPLMSLVGNMGYVGVVVVGAQLALTGNATPGDIQSFIQYVRNFTQPVQQLGNVSNTMQSMAAATERVFEFLAAPEEEQKADAQIPEKRPGHVVFDHVKFGYTPDKIIIHDFSCEAQPGQTIAIVGPTGAGKTTLIKLLQRFYDVDGGSLRVEGVDAVLLVVLPQGDARQRDEGLAARNPVPRIARDHLRPVARAADHELSRRVFEAADEVDLVRAARDGAAEDLLDGFRRAHFVERRREDDALALLQLGFEIARGHQVLVAVVAAGDVLPVFEIVVPVGRGHELRAGFAGLEIQPRKRTVEAAFHAVDGRIGVPVGLHVGMRQRMLVAEGEERAQPEARFRMGVDERVADHQLRALVNPEHLLLEDHAAYAIGDRGGRSVLEIGDVLVAARLVGPLETVQRQVERLVVLDDRFVERRQQDVGPVAVVDRGHRGNGGCCSKRWSCSYSRRYGPLRAFRAGASTPDCPIRFCRK